MNSIVLIACRSVLLKFVYLRNMIRLSGDSLDKIPKDGTFLFGMFMFFLLLLGFIRLQHPGYLKSLTSSLVNLRYVQLMLREGRLGWGFTNTLLDLITLFSISFYVEQLLSLSAFEVPFWEIIIMVFGVLGGQLLLAFGLGYAFFSLQYIGPFLMNMVVFNRVLGMGLLPLVVIATYGSFFSKWEWLLMVGGLVVGFLIFRGLRALIQMQGMFQHGLIYNFCYLCLIEIFPVIIVIDRILALLK